MHVTIKPRKKGGYHATFGSPLLDVVIAIGLPYSLGVVSNAAPWWLLVVCCVGVALAMVKREHAIVAAAVDHGKVLQASQDLSWSPVDAGVSVPADE